MNKWFASQDHRDILSVVCGCVYSILWWRDTVSFCWSVRRSKAWSPWWRGWVIFTLSGCLRSTQQSSTKVHRPGYHFVRYVCVWLQNYAGGYFKNPVDARLLKDSILQWCGQVSWDSMIDCCYLVLWHLVEGWSCSLGWCHSSTWSHLEISHWP